MGNHHLQSTEDSPPSVLEINLRTAAATYETTSSSEKQPNGLSCGLYIGNLGTGDHEVLSDGRKEVAQRIVTLDQKVVGSNPLEDFPLFLASLGTLCSTGAQVRR